MHALDLDIALSTLEDSPDETKRRECVEQARILLQTGQIQAQTYSTILMRLKNLEARQ